ncbi:TPA: HipA domain-containing protein [Escherichia coli]|nr:HipA domain-containing protein [Escherichia coli]HBL7859685.1 HipA domain-containing protein [Escherichia coli]
MPKLVTWMNNQRVGELTKLANGAHTFKYAPEWLASRYARPLSLSLPLQRRNITSDAVFNFFDNLLPDSPIVRDRIVKRYHAKSRQPFDLLSEIGRDSVGAVTLIPEDETIKAGRVRALAVKRFDRRWNTERTVLLRLPQEDMCQTFGLPSSVKYESDGGPGIAQIMAFLMGSSEALKDRYDFMKFQVFQWLIGATDGHAKNFSVFIQAGGSYRLTPFYDIISAFPVLGGTGIHISDLKLAMGLNASKGKKTAIDKIYPRHFLATAKVLKFPEVQMHEILSDFARMIPAALDNVKTSLPTDFPENVVTAVETNVLRLHGRLSREYGIK